MPSIHGEPPVKIKDPRLTNILENRRMYNLNILILLAISFRIPWFKMSCHVGKDCFSRLRKDDSPGKGPVIPGSVSH